MATKHSTPTRRTVIAASAALAATSLPAGAIGLVPDPIYAAIERHRIAYMRRMATGEVMGPLHTTDPGYDEAYDAADEAVEIVTDAAEDLAKIVPTTIAGLLALLDYVHAFNTGALYLPAAPENWHSSPECWPHLPAGEVAKSDKLDGSDSFHDTFPLYILRNVRAALKALA